MAVASIPLAQMPGMTRLIQPEYVSTPVPLCPLEKIPPILNRRILMLGTANITDANIYSNGLFQNIFFIYKLAEAVGWCPVLAVNERTKNHQDLSGIPLPLRNIRIATHQEIMEGGPIPIGLYLEIGMAIDETFKKFIQICGGRRAKLYLGNILNIDIENPIFYHLIPPFTHHYVPEQDEIWVSPHYGQHAQYATILNHLTPSPSAQRIAPYVWEPSLFLDEGRRHLAWRPKKPEEPPVIIIMEPNISFQKCGLLALAMAERFYLDHPDWKGKIIFYNYDKLSQGPYFIGSVLTHLKLYKDDHIEFVKDRKSIIDVMTDYPWATAICHQWNNDYNYMYLEFMYAGFPFIHNARAWREFGYYYEGNSIIGGAKQLAVALEGHGGRLEAAKGQARLLAWRHSIYNPEVQAAWLRLLES